MPQIAHTNQLNEVISQCLCGNKRSVHFQMHSFCPIRGVRCLSPHPRLRDKAWSSRSFSSAGSSRKLSHESRRKVAHRMTRMLDRRHIWNIIHNARSNSVTVRTHQNTAPATQQKMTPQHLAEICGKQVERHFRRDDPRMIRAWFDHENETATKWSYFSSSLRVFSIVKQQRFETCSTTLYLTLFYLTLPDLTYSTWLDSTWHCCENHVRELRTFFTVVLEPNIHTFSVLSETLPDFLKSKALLNSANSLLNTRPNPTRWMGSRVLLKGHAPTDLCTSCSVVGLLGEPGQSGRF